MTKNNRTGLPSQTSHDKMTDLLRLNQEIAYKGKIGWLREQYCLEQIRYMKVCHQKIGQDQIEHARARGGVISCGKGCSCCCYLYIGANLQECEAIAYYLYHHKPLLDSFIEKYPGWREAVRQGGDQFRNCEQLFTKMLLSGTDKQREQTFEAALRRHNKQNIACPFLENDLCLIYETRPCNCAGLFITTSPEQCQPQNNEDPRFNITTIDDVVSDTSFYYRSLSHPIHLYMPVAVYRILEEGFSYLAQFPGLEGLESEAMSDPEVKAIIQSLEV